MRRLLVRLLCSLGRILFSLRYKIEIKGLENIDDQKFKKRGGVLFLPNHPAHVDPIMIGIHLWSKREYRPLAIEYMYNQKIVHSFMQLMKALPIPNFESSVNDIKLKKAEQVMQIMIRGLKRGTSFMLYPAGRLKHTGKEVIGGASAAHRLLQECPEANVVLIRTTGLWGSRFSRALTGQSPNFMKQVKEGVFCILKNFFFFAPRRRVVIEFCLEPNDFPRKGSRVELNRYLENWYNQYQSDIGTVVTEEPLTLVSDSFYKKSFPNIEYTEKRKKILESLQITPEMEKIICDQIAKLSGQKNEQIKNEMSLSLDIGLDSLDIAQLVVFISDQFDVGEVHPEDLDTVQDALEVAAGREKSVRIDPEEEKEVIWPKEERLEPGIPSGKTIQEAFFNICDHMGDHAACGDDLVGILSYKKMKLAVLALSSEIKKLSGERIGIMLPASAGAYITILACLVAKKTPVMLNWTLGPKYLNHMVEVTGIKVVLSSWKFLERLTYVEVGDLAKKVHLLEKIKKKISFSQKLKALVLSKLSSDKLIKSLNLNSVKEKDPCVILFTSGTESTPKGVPLSHKNVLSNQRSGIQCVGVNKDDIFFGILPPFHSFGFSVAGLLPLLMGIRVAYYPDPTDSHGLAKGIQRWRVTIFCSAPSFLKSLLQVAKKRELKTLRLLVTGAEKASQELFDKVADLGEGRWLLEGYGITECAPIVCLTRSGQKAIGVGKVIPGVTIRTIHPETKEPLAPHQEGELCVAGPNVFSGYLDKEKDPFIQIDNVKFYRTGDIGHVDEEGNLILSGRMKRFAKIGGEMISLRALEETIHKGLKDKGVASDKAQVSVVASEKTATKAFLVLFTSQAIEPKEVNHMLKAEGFSRIVKISQVYHLEEIPLMGSGKVDYRRLQSLVETLGNE